MTDAVSLRDVDTLGGRAFDRRWDIDFHISFTFEVPLRQLLPALPDGVQPVEPVPEIGLFNVIHARYVPGTVGDARGFDEVVCSAIVAPDLGVPMPVPRQTLCVLDVVSNSERFVQTKIPTLRMPVRHDPSLVARIDADALGCAVSDAAGPIFTLRCSEAEPRYREREFCGQYFARTDGALHHGVWSWWGSLHETQRHRRGAGQLHGHPMFDRVRIDPTRLRDCYLQQVSRPGTRVHMRTFAPVVV